MTKKIGSLTLATVGISDKVKQGQLEIAKGKLMKALICKMTIPVQNTTGGNAALSDAQKQALLDLFEMNFMFGQGKEFQPYVSQRLSRIHKEARRAFNSEIEGYTDTTTGLGQTITNGATANCVVYLPIPTGFLWDLPATERHLFGIGRSQAKTVEFELKRLSSTIAANWAVNGTVTVELYPHYDSCKGDVWGLVPHYKERDETNDTVVFASEDGLPLEVRERTATHAATALTNVSVWVDDEEIHDQVGPAEIIRELNDDCLLAAAGLITDRETILMKPLAGTSLRWLQTGKVKVKQNKKDLATIKLGLLYVPIVGDDVLQKQIQAVAGAKYRAKPIKAASAALFQGLDLPTRTQALPAFVIYDTDDREYQQLPGYTASPNGPAPVLAVPETLVAMAKGKAGRHADAGEKAVADKVAKDLTAMVPGGVANGRGGMGNVYASIRSFFGA